ncbi:hypothetical protein AMR41_28885 [Hapalosiphon sp. MRB220]|nr:hypothetical protein AMR41_28885 [Hapalosiphon sp. MRB220]
MSLSRVALNDARIWHKFIIKVGLVSELITLGSKQGRLDLGIRDYKEKFSQLAVGFRPKNLLYV